ncbi:MAG TPA: hypothetical protein PLJ60_01475 [Chryseolinea sp.]|nr:hypothetical protein [Chryseolinea sp.]HPM28977.1 hypothetical protein [Chryseolinea sp.]
MKLRLKGFGITLDSENDIGRRVSFSNIVFLALPIVYLIFMLFDIKSYFQPIKNLRFDQFVVPIIIGVCIFCLWLNKIKQTTLSRVLFIVVWPVLLHLIPIILLQTPADYYLAFPIGIIFHSILIQLIFSQRDEAFLFWFFIVVNFITMIFVLDILLLFDTDYDVPNVLTEHSYYVLDGILYWLLFNLVTFYMILSIGKYIERVNTARKLINGQKEEMDILNKSLESKVTERTLKLEEQNLKLREHAFYNAHLLRGPFCRVQGLIQLQGLVRSDTEKNEIESMLKYSIEELEGRIREIQKIVDSENELIS